MKISKDQVLETLKTIIHPSAERDIVSLEMVQNLSLKKNRLQMDLVFTSAQDPLKSSLKRACEITLKDKFPSLEEITVSIQTPMKPITPVAEEKVLPLVKNIIAISSGKGGVGKSTVASNLALAFAGAGMKVGLIDADIFGPSIPRMLGLEDARPQVTKIEGKDKLIPVERYGIKVLSIGFFVEKEDATVWRGPMASNALKQLISDTEWGELDYLFVDLPPGTSDIHLTLVQTVSVTGAIIVSTPQPVALADVIKGINMFRNDTINVPVLGLIENMSWFTPEELPDNRYYIFGKNGCAELAQKMNVPLLGQIPLVQSVREGGDNGEPVVLRNSEVSNIYKSIAESLRIQVIKRNTDMDPTQKVEITRKNYSDLK
jgi:ATP-binding protein involved in chromosome partitioning